MNLFDVLVDEALQNSPQLAPLRVVVEKELLHHDILRVLGQAGLLGRLTFIGGTCLRACYASNRLSEDLDFTGGGDFSRELLSDMAALLVGSLQQKYGLQVSVTEPVREEGNVDTWKLKVLTRPERKDLPAQRINIDVCAVPSYDARPTMLLNPYGVEMGTSGLIVMAQSREEIFVDKLLALALRPNRVKYRDVWDLAWLHQRQIEPAMTLLKSKLDDHHTSVPDYLQALAQRVKALRSDQRMAQEFRDEMSRFLPNELVKATVQSDDFWRYVGDLMSDYERRVTQTLQAPGSSSTFSM